MEADEEIKKQKQQQSRKLQRVSSSDENTGMRNWNNPSSRIIRVSQTKDRHSKVLTSKGLRDRRIRLSVTTAIQFYDLQDRLGFDQPSKAVEWLINKASDSITDLPQINTDFNDFNDQTLSLSKSAGSSGGTSESSLLSLSRTEIPGKGREKTENEQNSFTQLLTGGLDEPARNWTGSSVCYNPVQLIRNSSSSTSLHQFNNNNNHRQESMNQNQFSFVPNYNFGISSSDSAAINGGFRGTLQSNSQSFFLNNNQRSSSPIDSQSIPFFMATPPPLDHRSHQLPPAAFNGWLHLSYGQGNKNSDDKGKDRR